MKSATRALRDARKLGNAMVLAGTNTRKTGELTTAAGQVVAKRMALGATAVIDPLNADHVEFAKIIPEKTMAFSEAGVTWLHWSGEVAERRASFAAREMAYGADAAVAMARCRTPAGVIATQSIFASAWFARALSQSIALGSLVMRSQGAVMAPIHRAATANARRLSR
jgi:hypothetical protein